MFATPTTESALRESNPQASARRARQGQPRTESRTELFRNMTFEGNDVLLCDRGMVLYCYDSATFEKIRFLDNRFEQPYLDAKQRLIDFKVQGRDGKGLIRDVLVRNCRADVAWPQASTLRGLEASHGVEGVRFENLVIAGRHCRSAEEARVTLLRHVKDVKFR